MLSPWQVHLKQTVSSNRYVVISKWEGHRAPNRPKKADYMVAFYNKEKGRYVDKAFFEGKYSYRDAKKEYDKRLKNCKK